MPEGGKKDGGDDPGSRIIKLLSPHREKLGTGEGARLLGQALAAQGKFDESYACWDPIWTSVWMPFTRPSRPSKTPSSRPTIAS